MSGNHSGSRVVRCTFCNRIVNDGGEPCSYSIRWYKRKRVVVCSLCDREGRVPPQTEDDLPKNQEKQIVERSQNTKRIEKTEGGNQTRTEIRIGSYIIELPFISDKGLARSLKVAVRTLLKMKNGNFAKKFRNLADLWGVERAECFVDFLITLPEISQNPKHQEFIKERNKQY